MPRSIISYDKELPEIPDRRAWERPASYLVKDESSPSGWSVNDSGRRPSRLLLISKLRTAVDDWRGRSYPGISEVGRRLFEYWFEEDHEVAGFPVPFRYHFCQREAIETLVYVVEILGLRDTKALIDGYAEVFQKDLYSKSIEFQTTMEGQRQIRRYVPELDGEGIQDLPPVDLRRHAFKMATGSGKTWVMAMAMVWSHFHRKRVAGSDLSTNFLIVAPNVIVYQRLEKDFDSNQIFYGLPLIPPEWNWSQKVIKRGDSAEPDPSGNLFLTNVHQLYESRDQAWTPENAIDAILGPKPNKDLTSYQRSMLERLKSLRDLVILNDEAHHVHDEDLAWSQSLLALHRSLPKGLSLWLDFSATPKDQNGMYFPWTLCDWPLAQAVEDRIVKAPIIVNKEADPELPEEDPDHVTKENAADKYRYWIQAAVSRWKEHSKAYKQLGIKPVLFIMAEKNIIADAIGRCLVQEFRFKEPEVLVIHTDEAGEITKKDLEKAREAARDIDKADSKYKVVVSVMMLREGWDVRNVTVVLGLRPYTAKAEILPEQVIGRGLRLMVDVGPDRTQTLEVLGTRNLLKVLRSQLELEGVGVGTSAGDPPVSITIYPMQERLKYDIALPMTKPSLTHNIRKLTDLDPLSLNAIFEQEELDEVFRMSLRMEFATTETEVHQADIVAGDIPLSQQLLGALTQRVIRNGNLGSVFAELYPLVREYVASRCFGKEVDLDEESIRSHLYRLEIQEGIAKYLAREISKLTIETKTLEFERSDFLLSATKPFHWRRNLPPLEANKTVFNYVATYNDFERQFAVFLDKKAGDVLRFASLATTEQGDSGTPFRVDYLKPSGAIGFYHPDWVVVQKDGKKEINWIIETKGRVWEGTDAKDAAANLWCERVSQATGQTWRFRRVNQAEFMKQKVSSFSDLISEAKKLF